jgi:hypothetical protein
MNCNVRYHLELSIELANSVTISPDDWSDVPYDTVVSGECNCFNTTTKEYTVPITGVYIINQSFIIPTLQRLLVNGAEYKRAYSDMTICKKFCKGEKLKLQIKPEQNEILPMSSTRDTSASINLIYIDDSALVEAMSCQE